MYEDHEVDLDHGVARLFVDFLSLELCVYRWLFLFEVLFLMYRFCESLTCFDISESSSQSEIYRFIMSIASYEV